jgi:tetratricopeptide (TPR) repeat protein
VFLLSKIGTMATPSAEPASSQAAAQIKMHSNAPAAADSGVDTGSARAHAQLGYLYASQGNRQRATAELKEAEILNRPGASDEIDVERLACLGYAALDEAQPAAAHYERVAQIITKAMKRGVDSAGAERLQGLLLE